MRKTVLGIIFFLINLNCFCQQHENDIYIFIDKKSVVEACNDSVLFQKFVLDFNVGCNNEEIKLVVDKNDPLTKNIEIKSSSNKNINLIYKDENYDNAPVLVNKIVYSIKKL